MFVNIVHRKTGYSNWLLYASTADGETHARFVHATRSSIAKKDALIVAMLIAQCPRRDGRCVSDLRQGSERRDAQ